MRKNCTIVVSVQMLFVYLISPGPIYINQNKQRLLSTLKRDSSHVRMIFVTAFSFLIILLSTYVSCEMNSDFYEKWIEDYRKVSGKLNPPTKYKEWIRIAMDLRCSYDPSDYKQIFSDLSTFNDMDLNVDLMKRYEQKIIKLGRKIDGYNMINRRTSNWPISDTWNYVSRVLDPSINFYVLVQLMDEGMSIPADVDQEQPYEDMDDVPEMPQT